MARLAQGCVRAALLRRAPLLVGAGRRCHRLMEGGEVVAFTPAPDQFVGEQSWSEAASQPGLEVAAEVAEEGEEKEGWKTRTAPSGTCFDGMSELSVAHAISEVVQQRDAARGKKRSYTIPQQPNRAVTRKRSWWRKYARKREVVSLRRVSIKTKGDRVKVYFKPTRGKHKVQLVWLYGSDAVHVYETVLSESLSFACHVSEFESKLDQLGKVWCTVPFADRALTEKAEALRDQSQHDFDREVEMALLEVTEAPGQFVENKTVLTPKRRMPFYIPGLISARSILSGLKEKELRSVVVKVGRDLDRIRGSDPRDRYRVLPSLRTHWTRLYPGAVSEDVHLELTFPLPNTKENRYRVEAAIPGGNFVSVLCVCLPEELAFVRLDGLSFLPFSEFDIKVSAPAGDADRGTPLRMLVDRYGTLLFTCRHDAPVVREALKQLGMSCSKEQQ